MGIISILSKVTDWVPNKKEYIRNQIDKLERQYEEIKENPYTEARGRKLERIARKLRKLKEKAVNA